jgi:hypothetical protein
MSPEEIGQQTVSAYFFSANHCATEKNQIVIEKQ